MVDLRTLKAGDTVVFRNGGKSVVKKSYVVNRIFTITYIGDGDFDYYNGGSFYEEKQTPFDIIEIIRAPVADEVREFLNGLVEQTPKKFYTGLAHAITAKVKRELRDE